MSMICALAAEAVDLFVQHSDGGYRAATSDEILAAARAALLATVRRGQAMSSPEVVAEYVRLHIAVLDYEVFCVIFLDSQNRIIDVRQMFRGTVTQTSVYPREVVKEALALNASAVIFLHNHPSSQNEPSRADEHLTATLKTALSLVDVRVLDHFIVSRSGVESFAKRGLL